MCISGFDTHGVQVLFSVKNTGSLVVLAAVWIRLWPWSRPQNRTALVISCFYSRDFPFSGLGQALQCACYGTISARLSWFGARGIYVRCIYVKFLYMLFVSEQFGFWFSRRRWALQCTVLRHIHAQYCPTRWLETQSPLLCYVKMSKVQKQLLQVKAQLA